MLNKLARLPPDVLQVQVLTHFSCKDIARLDAACRHSNSQALQQLYSYCPTIKLPASLQSTPLVWEWFWKRSLRLNQISVEMDVKFDFSCLDQYSELFESIALNGIATDHSSSLATLKPQQATKIQSAHISKFTHGDPIWSIALARLCNLKKLRCTELHDH
jgi:hypothetical protein